MKSVFAMTALAVIGFAGAAYAGSATAPKPMSDSEMDRVTAGVNPGHGRVTAIGILGHSPGESTEGVAHHQGELPTGGFPSVGRCTANLPTAICGVSDIRLKRDIVQVAHLDNGLTLYRYRYKWSDQVYVGVMAQEVLLVRPDAVVRGADGYLRVDYSRLHLHLMTWEEWVASPFKTAQNATTAIAPKAMSDSEMDKVTAGDGSGTLGAPGDPSPSGLGNVETFSKGAGARISAGVGNGTADSAHVPPH